ncbi:MAG: nickel-dependent lactate racemase [Spirochaetes bacterium]|nr:nickel-dependent lactate racemase [Spirochaetota bacterium]
MEVKLPWGPGSLSVDVPDTWNVIFPERKSAGKKKKVDELAAVKESLKKPVGAKPLQGRKLRGKKIVIVVDDNTRPTPAHKFFHIILDALKKSGASLKAVTVIPALGIHTPMNVSEMAEKIGAANLKKVKWENHDAFDLNKNHYFGSTSRNTPIYLNRRLKDADLVVLVGLVEPHLWAGFGGGMKNILPGVAYSETIGIHHEIIAEPPYRFNRVGVMPEENSFRQDLEEIRRMIAADIFCVNVVLDHGGKIIASFAGDPIKAHRAGIAFNRAVCGLEIERQVDGIIVNSFPMDINFKQSMKCVGNSLPALAPGGAVMAFMRAERGLDDIKPPKGAPLPVLKAILRLIGPARVRGFLDRVRKGLGVEEKFLVYYSLQLVRQYDMYFYVPSLSAGEAKQLGFFVRCAEPADVIRHGVKKIGKHATVAVFPEGGVTFPIVGE